jgi:putative sigma-54 modulation protein
MKIIIKSTNIDLNPSIKQYVESKIGSLKKFLKKFNPELTEAKVEVGKITQGQRQGEIFRAEVNLSVDGDLIRVEKTEESLNAAIDLLRDDLANKIREYKDKKETQNIRGARSWKKFWQINPLARFRSSKVKNILKKK